jgi:hypothetical protein
MLGSLTAYRILYTIRHSTGRQKFAKKWRVMDTLLYFQRTSSLLSATVKWKVKAAAPAFAERARSLDTADSISAAAIGSLKPGFPLASAVQLNILAFYLVGVVAAVDGLDSAQDTLKNKLDSMSEMGEMESLRLQMSMDRLSKMMSTLSNLLKKISDTSSSITQNIK